MYVCVCMFGVGVQQLICLIEWRIHNDADATKECCGKRRKNQKATKENVVVNFVTFFAVWSAAESYVRAVLW